MTAPMRTFDTGATRNVDQDKLDFEGFLSPLVLKRFAEYMHANRKQADGNYRDSDNWQKGIPLDAYAKSQWRHFFDFWSEHRGVPTVEGLETSICAQMFNLMGYLHEHLKAKQQAAPAEPVNLQPGAVIHEPKAPAEPARMATVAEIEAYDQWQAKDAHGTTLLIGDTVRIVDPSHDDVLHGFGKGSFGTIAGRSADTKMVLVQSLWRSKTTRWLNSKQLEWVRP